MSARGGFSKHISKSVSTFDLDQALAVYDFFAERLKGPKLEVFFDDGTSRVVNPSSVREVVGRAEHNGLSLTKIDLSFVESSGQQGDRVLWFESRWNKVDVAILASVSARNASPSSVDWARSAFMDLERLAETWDKKFTPKASQGQDVIKKQNKHGLEWWSWVAAIVGVPVAIAGLIFIILQ